MPDAEKPIKYVTVQSGTRILRAHRLSTGNWRLDDTNGFHYRTVNHQEFQSGYTLVPEKDA